LRGIGFIPCNTNSTLQREAFSIKAALGFVPAYIEVVLKNATGAALASSGNTVDYVTYLGSVA